MEVLSIGEKIKRTRVYKGLTLKDLCGDKISVSKMSCIENGKIYPDDWILGIVAEKLELQINYLKQDVHDQLLSNMENLINKKSSEELYKELIYNVETAVANAEYYIAFDLISILYEHYLNKREIKKAEELHFLYYDILQKSFDNYNGFIFSINMGRYLLYSGEYSQALIYFIRVDEDSPREEYELIARALYYEIICYSKIHNTELTYEKAESLFEIIPHIEKQYQLAEFNRVIACVNIGKDKEKFLLYRDKAEKYYISDSHRAKALLNFARGFFENSQREDGVIYLAEAQKLFPKDDEYKYVSFMLESVRILIENGYFKIVNEIIDDILNRAIGINELKFIDKGYYYKAMVCKHDENCDAAEMYMNLSIDALSKIGTKKEIYQRYLEIGNMYYNMKNTKESIKYFNYAVNLSKKL